MLYPEPNPSPNLNRGLNPIPDPDNRPRTRGRGAHRPSSETQQPLRGGIRHPPHPTNPIGVVLRALLPLGGGLGHPGVL